MCTSYALCTSLLVFSFSVTGTFLWYMAGPLLHIAFRIDSLDPCHSRVSIYPNLPRPVRKPWPSNSEALRRGVRHQLDLHVQHLRASHSGSQWIFPHRFEICLLRHRLPGLSVHRHLLREDLPGHLTPTGRNHARKTRGEQTSAEDVRIDLRHFPAFWSLAMIGVVFYFFLLPVIIYPEAIIIALVTDLYLLVLNLMISPTIYFWRLKEFRSTVPLPRFCRGNEIRQGADEERAVGMNNQPTRPSID